MRFSNEVLRSAAMPAADTPTPESISGKRVILVGAIILFVVICGLLLAAWRIRLGTRSWASTHPSASLSASAASSASTAASAPPVGP